MTSPSLPRPLEGLRVLEFGQLVAAPYCGMLLADAGAGVLKIQRPGAGEGGRTLGSVFIGGESSGFLSFNWNKGNGLPGSRPCGWTRWWRTTGQGPWPDGAWGYWHLP